MSFRQPKSLSELKDITNVVKGRKFHVLGQGWNTLFSKKEYGEEEVFLATEWINRSIRIEEDRIFVGAGYSLNGLCEIAAQNGLAGIESLWGIPSSIGGAIAMNAGAFGTQISDHLEKVYVHNPISGKERWLSKTDLWFGIRQSRIRRSGEIIVSAVFSLRSCNKQEIRKKMRQIGVRRSLRYPIYHGNCGSVFVRDPDKEPVSAIIDRLNLKGLRSGGAVVSNLHAGFIINQNNATGAEILELIDLVGQKIENKEGWRPKVEQRII